MKATFILCKDRIEYTKEMTTEDKAQLFDTILYYNNDQPIWELSYVVKVVFSKMKNFFDEQNQKYEEKIVKRNKENGAKWGRPPSKKPKKPTGLKWNPDKPKETLTETDTDNSLSNERENNSNELLELDINSTSLLNNNTGTWQNLKKFWNQEINEIMEMVASINEGAMDGTQARNRQFANNLLKKIKAMPKVASGEITWQSVLEMVITLNKDDEYHATKLTSPENIYRNFGSLVSLARTKYQEQNKKQKSDWVF